LPSAQGADPPRMKPTVSFSIDANLLGGVWHPSADRRAFWGERRSSRSGGSRSGGNTSKRPSLRRGCLVRAGPAPGLFRRRQHLRGHDIIDSQIDLRQRISK
jgi:hypothetical protein